MAGVRDMTGLTPKSTSSLRTIAPEERSHEVDHPSSLVAQFGADKPLKLDCGVDLSPFQIAYQTYGELNADKSNAVLICHACLLYTSDAADE